MTARYSRNYYRGSDRLRKLFVYHSLVTMIFIYDLSFEMSLRQNLATNLRRIRAKREMSQDDFAALIDIHRTYLNHLEGAKRSPTIDVIEKVAERLDVTFVDLLRDPHDSS